MAYYDVTDFAGTTIVSATVKQLAMSDTTRVISRIGYLENGTKFDADGTADADTTPGQVIARYQIIPATAGMVALESVIAPLVALRGKRGTLTGKMYSPTVTTTRTCTARCIDAVKVEVNESGPPMLGTRRTRVELVMVWEKLTEWA